MMGHMQVIFLIFQLFFVCSEILPLIENDSLILEFAKGQVLRTGFDND